VDVGTWRPWQRNSRSAVHLPGTQLGGDALSTTPSSSLLQQNGNTQFYPPPSLSGMLSFSNSWSSLGKPSSLSATPSSSPLQRNGNTQLHPRSALSGMLSSTNVKFKKMLPFSGISFIRWSRSNAWRGHTSKELNKSCPLCGPLALEIMRHPFAHSRPTLPDVGHQ